MRGSFGFVGDRREYRFLVGFVIVFFVMGKKLYF